MIAMTKIAILGGTGYTACELIKILLRHPHAEIVAVTSRDEKMPAVAESHPSLAGRIDLRMEPFDADRLLAKGVAVRLRLLAARCVDGRGRRLAQPRGNVRVIDLSADYRLRDPNVYAQWYGESHQDLANLAQAVYGLPEIYGDEIKTAQLIANPGCYPQTGILGLAPLVAGKYIDLKDIIIDSKSGRLRRGPHAEADDAFSRMQRKRVGLQRRHSIATRRRSSRRCRTSRAEPVEVIFTPHLIPMDRGIFTTIYATPRRAFTEPQLLELYRAYYAECSVRARHQSNPGDQGQRHSNFLDVTVRVVRGRIVVLVAEDNLVRGASGVAVQNFNRMFGHDEKTGLW